MLIEYQDKVLSYVLGVEGLKIGDKVVSGDKTEVQKGNSMMLKISQRAHQFIILN